MIRKITLSAYRLLLILSIFISAKTSVYAQKITLRPLDGLEKLCAGPTFNEFNATFDYEDFPADVTFEVQISDVNGDFSTVATSTKTIDVFPVSATQQRIRFAVPIDLAGSDTYSLRIKSSTGFVSGKIRNSLGSTTFPAYYKKYEGPFSINKKSLSAVICSGGSLTLSVDNDTPTVIGSSPATYPNFKYIWFKDFVVIPGQTSSTLVVNSPGDYYCQIDYGMCTESNNSSNIIKVSASGSGSSVSIESSLGNPFCAGADGTILTATASGNGYVWRKDGAIIENQNGRTISTKESGVYTVEVDFGGCSATGTIDLKSNSFTASLNVPQDNKIALDGTLSVTVTTDAVSPNIEWYLNNVLISEASGASFTASKRGNYVVKISQNTGCISAIELPFKISFEGDGNTTITKIANIISLSSDLYYVWDIPSEYKNPETRVIILSSNGDKVIDTVDYQGDWPEPGTIDFKNVNPVYYYVIQSDTGEKKGSITVIK